MWPERIKGLLVIAILGFLSFGLVRFLTAHREEIVRGKLDFSPQGLEQQVLGVVNQVRKKSQGETPEEDLTQPIQSVEQKADDLINEIKNLPQEQAEVVKTRVLKEICGELMEEGND